MLEEVVDTYQQKKELKEVKHLDSSSSIASSGRAAGRVKECLVWEVGLSKQIEKVNHLLWMGLSEAQACRSQLVKSSTNNQGKVALEEK